MVKSTWYTGYESRLGHGSTGGGEIATEIQLSSLRECLKWKDWLDVGMNPAGLKNFLKH